jgi:hypothetical protein
MPRRPVPRTVGTPSWKLEGHSRERPWRLLTVERSGTATILPTSFASGKIGGESGVVADVARRVKGENLVG